MRCDDVQSYLADHLAGRLADRLSDTVQTYIRAHMMACPDCCEKLEDFEEMQTILRMIPIEACDSNAMRAEFDASRRQRMRAYGLPAFSSLLWQQTRQARLAWVIGTMLFLTAALIVSRQTIKWRPSAPAPTVAENSGEVTGQVRTADGAPARGVRIALMAVPQPGTAPAMDLIRVEQTDADGRYRLQKIPPGRYYAIAGSVDVPTYFPGTPDIGAATVVSIQPGGVAAGIDFSRFVPALTVDESNASIDKPALPAVLSGVLHYPDGSPAGGIPVYAIPVDFAKGFGAEPVAFHFSKLDLYSASSIARAQLREMQNRIGHTGATRARMAGSVTDSGGQYRLELSGPGSYYVAAGFADSPAFYPGVSGLQGAKPVSTTSAVRLDALHFTVPLPAVNRVSGRIVAAAGALPGIAVELRSTNAAASLLPPRPSRQVQPDVGGLFELNDVPSGTYTLEARLADGEFVTRDVIVAEKPVSGVQLMFRNVMESVKDASVSPLVPVAVTVRLDTGDRLPYKPDTSIVFTGVTGKTRVAASVQVGNLFQASVPPNDSYSISVSNTAAGYAVQSIVSGATDLMNGGRLMAGSNTTGALNVVVTLTKQNR